jgi:transcriptional regulator with XRE-family HTH domain
VSVIDGPTLRALREQHNVPLRQVARLSRLSHGHLSKVEHGEPGRPVTATVLAAYQKATGVTLTHGEPGDDPGGWRPGQIGDKARRAFSGKVAAIAWGGPLEDRLDRVVANRCRLPLPTTVDASQVSQLAQVTTVLASLPGPLPGLIARAVLGWAVELPDRATPERVRADLYAVVARLAKRAARAGVDVGSHTVARTLQLVALHAAALADAPDLRARVIADIAVHLDVLEHHSDSQAVVRLGEIDERITDQTRKFLHEVKTRAADAEQQVTSAVRQALATDADRVTEPSVQDQDEAGIGS